MRFIKENFKLRNSKTKSFTHFCAGKKVSQSYEEYLRVKKVFKKWL